MSYSISKANKTFAAECRGAVAVAGGGRLFAFLLMAAEGAQERDGGAEIKESRGGPGTPGKSPELVTKEIPSLKRGSACQKHWDEEKTLQRWAMKGLKHGDNNDVRFPLAVLAAPTAVERKTGFQMLAAV